MTTVDHFEDKYQAASDPWGYRHSTYEQAKYAATLAACGPGPFESALELGGSIGVFSARLAPRCRRLTTIERHLGVTEAPRTDPERDTDTDTAPGAGTDTPEADAE